MAKKIDPTKLTPADLARLLRHSGSPATAAVIHKNIKAGAPTNKNGTLHLIHYTAWLASQVA